MTRYIIRRLLQAIPLLFVISVIVFGLIQISPNNPLSALQNNPNISPEDLLRLENEYGLHDPIPLKYAKWLGQTLQGNWGDSFVTHRPVLTEISERLANTLYLSGIAFILALLIAIPFGMISAIRQYSLFDHIVTTIAFMGQSIPIFWFGLILIIVFSVNIQNPFAGTALFPHPAPLPLFPGGGMTTLGDLPPDPWVDRVWHLVLPVTMLAVFQLAQHFRYTRAGMLDVLKGDFIRTARAKGLRERAVIVRHAFKNAAIPIITLVGMELGTLLGGAVITETIFAWPGVGQLAIQAIYNRDFPVVQAAVMNLALIFVLINLVVDILYTYLDPRVRYD